MANLNDTTMTIVPCVVRTPTQLDPLDPTVQPMQIMLFSQADPSQGNQSFPIDLFAALMNTSTQLETLEEEGEEAKYLPEGYESWSSNNAPLVAGDSLVDALAKLEARLIEAEEWIANQAP